MSYTKGEWSYRDCPVHAGAETSNNDAGRVKLVDYNDGEFTGVVAIVQTEESEANAKLIAAAPDLLDALEGMVYVFESCLNNVDDGEKYKIYLRAKAAIEQAILLEDNI